MTPAGQLDRRITVQQPKANPTALDSGEVDWSDDDNWEDFCGRWAKIMTRGGREFWKLDQVEGDVTLVCRVRYDGLTALITNRYRVQLDDRTFQIVAAYDVDDAHENVDLVCIEDKT